MFVELRAMLARRKFRLDELNDRVLRKVQGTVLNSMELNKFFSQFFRSSYPLWWPNRSIKYV